MQYLGTDINEKDT